MSLTVGPRHFCEKSHIKAKWAPVEAGYQFLRVFPGQIVKGRLVAAIAVLSFGKLEFGAVVIPDDGTMLVPPAISYCEGPRHGFRNIVARSKRKKVAVRSRN